MGDNDYRTDLVFPKDAVVNIGIGGIFGDKFVPLFNFDEVRLDEDLRLHPRNYRIVPSVEGVA